MPRTDSQTTTAKDGQDAARFASRCGEDCGSCGRAAACAASMVDFPRAVEPTRAAAR